MTSRECMLGRRQTLQSVRCKESMSGSVHSFTLGSKKNFTLFHWPVVRSHSWFMSSYVMQPWNGTMNSLQGQSHRRSLSLRTRKNSILFNYFILFYFNIHSPHRLSHVGMLDPIPGGLQFLFQFAKYSFMPHCKSHFNYCFPTFFSFYLIGELLFLF